MTEKQAIFEKIKDWLKILTGAKLPGWVYPATIGAAITPVIGHALEEANKRKRMFQQAPAVLQNMMTQLPPSTGLRYTYAPAFKHASDDKVDIIKLAQGLERMRALMNEAKKRGRKRKADAMIDTKPNTGMGGGRAMRGRSSGSMRLGDGGGRGR
jgi:hypothetical protein